jgi:hypothetical protein
MTRHSLRQRGATSRRHSHHWCACGVVLCPALHWHVQLYCGLQSWLGAVRRIVLRCVGVMPVWIDSKRSGSGLLCGFGIIAWCCTLFLVPAGAEVQGAGSCDAYWHQPWQPQRTHPQLLW